MIIIDAEEQEGSSFGAAIRNVERSVLQSIHLHEGCRLRKKRLREKWEQKSKILPSSLLEHCMSYSQSLNASHARRPLIFKTLDQVNVKSIGLHLHSPKQVDPDESTRKPSGVRLFPRLPKKWKLEYRNDELNVLKFSQPTTHTHSSLHSRPNSQQIRTDQMERKNVKSQWRSRKNIKRKINLN